MPQVEQAPSLRDTVAAAFENDSSATTSAPEPSPSAIGAAPDSGTGQTNNPSTDGTANATPQAAAKPDKTDKEPAEPARAADPADDEPGGLDAPVRWTEEEKKAFYELPQKAQEVLLKRNKAAEAEITKRFQAVSERSKQFDAIEETLKPFVPRMALNGHTPATYLKNVLTVGTFAEDRPEEFIKFFAQQKGINLAALAGGVQQPQQMQRQPVMPNGQQAHIDPVTGQLVQHVSALQQRLEQVTGVIQREYEAQKARTNAEITREIETFETAADEHGNLRHPFLDDVEQDMVLLIQNGETDLEKAYERAVWSNPATRQKLLEQERLKTGQRVSVDAQRKAREAQKSSASLRSTGGPAAVQDNGSKNLRDQISRALDATQRRDAV